MDNFNALLSHQGLLKHVNHAHRQCAPTPTGRYTVDENGRMSGGLGDLFDPSESAASRQSDDELMVNIELFQLKVRHITAMRQEASNLQPIMDHVWEEVRKMDEQVASLGTQIEEFLAEHMRRLFTRAA